MSVANLCHKLKTVASGEPVMSTVLQKTQKPIMSFFYFFPFFF